MDPAEWPQESMGGRAPAMSERRVRRQNDQPLNCPRCNSNNTKFCYYNNYSETQPRYFCKTCRRYWTDGGSLRNIPVGGGSRKNKRSSSSATATSLSTTPPSKTNISVTCSMQLNHDIVGLPEIENFSNMELLRNEINGAGFGSLGLGIPVGAGRGGGGHDEGRLLFTSIAHDTELEQNRGQGGPMQDFWNGMMGGGGSW